MYKTQLKTFLAVCDTGSFSKAAAVLFITPSAVLQQIRSLEEELGASLFIRSTKGVELTQAGQYLEHRGRGFVQMGDEIIREIQEISTRKNQICIGSSMMEKCRLLYDLWVLFSQAHNEYMIQMVNIDASHNIPVKTDLIESVNSYVGWMREWEFLQICTVPLGMAFVTDHPLAGKPVITSEDLRGETVMTINKGSCDAVAGILEYLKKQHIPLVYHDVEEGNMLWESAFHRFALLVPMCWSDILIDMKVSPFEKTFSLPYGIFYRAKPGDAVREFLAFIQETYRGGNQQGIVPVL